MRGRLRRFFVDNWPIKLAALALALLLYVRVQTLRVHTEDFAVALDVAIPADRRLLASPPPVHVTVAGTGSDLLGLRRLPGVIRTAVPDTVTGSAWTVRLQPGDVTIPSGLDVTVLDVQPREVLLALDTVAVRYVRVVPMVGSLPDSGFVAPEAFEVTPRAVRVVGAAAAVGAVESVLTAPLDLHGATGPFLRRADLDTTGLTGLRVAPRAVTVSGEVGALFERTFIGVPVESGAGGIADATPVPARVSVSVRGPEARVRALTRDSLQIVAHVAAGTTSSAGRYARLTVIAPPGVVARAVPDSVLLPPRAGRP
jgi:hypothetical protein